MPVPRPSVSSALAAAAARIGGDSARLDAELLLCEVLECSRAWLFAHAGDTLPEAGLDAFGALVARREQGEPVAHILGRRGFWTLELAVDASTLIPRPDTETLVEVALGQLATDAAARVADLGTGTGAVALAIASERPRVQVVGVERDPDALALARRNLAASGLANVELRGGSWYGPLAGERYAMIVSNPPYIASDDPHLDQGDVCFEPRSALVAGTDGLDDIRLIAAGASGHLEPGGWLVLEHGHAQGAAVRGLLAAAGLVDVDTRTDLAGRERVSLARVPLSRR